METQNQEIAVALVTERDPITHQDMSYTEGIAHIKRSHGKTLFVHVDMIMRRPTGNIERPVDRTTVGSTIILHKPELLRFLNSAVPNSLRTDWKLQISECSDCLFVGGF